LKVKKKNTLRNYGYGKDNFFKGKNNQYKKGVKETMEVQRVTKHFYFTKLASRESTYQAQHVSPNITTKQS
jgi:hypothetical protein